MAEKWAGNQEGFNEIYIHGGEQFTRSWLHQNRIKRKSQAYVE